MVLNDPAGVLISSRCCSSARAIPLFLPSLIPPCVVCPGCRFSVRSEYRAPNTSCTHGGMSISCAFTTAFLSILLQVFGLARLAVEGHADRHLRGLSGLQVQRAQRVQGAQYVVHAWWN